MSQHCWAQHVACVWPPCCDMLAVVGSSLKLVKFEPTTPNMLQLVAPNNVAICCVDILRSFGRGLNTERTYKWKLSGAARQSEIGILCFDWLIHPGVPYSREIWIFSEREGSFKAFYGIQPWGFHFLFNVIIQTKSHFAICSSSSVVSNFFALNMEQFEE